MNEKSIGGRPGETQGTRKLADSVKYYKYTQFKR